MNAAVVVGSVSVGAVFFGALLFKLVVYRIAPQRPNSVLRAVVTSALAVVAVVAATAVALDTLADSLAHSAGDVGSADGDSTLVRHERISHRDRYRALLREPRVGAPRCRPHLRFFVADDLNEHPFAGEGRPEERFSADREGPTVRPEPVEGATTSELDAVHEVRVHRATFRQAQCDRCRSLSLFESTLRAPKLGSLRLATHRSPAAR